MSNIKSNVRKSNIIRIVIALVILIVTIGTSVFAAGYTTLVAWIVSAAVYQIGSLF